MQADITTQTNGAISRKKRTLVTETASSRGDTIGPGGGRRQQFEIQTLDQEAQGAPPFMHTHGRAARGREETIPALSYRRENCGLAKKNTAEMRTTDSYVVSA